MIPGHSWQSGSHTNSLVPLYAKGVGAQRFAERIINVDENLVAGYGLENGGFDGSYIDNTAIYEVMHRAAIVPEPTGLVLLALGSLLGATCKNR